jgi:integration host factor subunit beta
MIKSELVARSVEQNPHLCERECEAIAKTIFDRITDVLGNGDRVEIRGFGTFTVAEKRARIGRNPRTGESVAVAEKRNVHFKTGTDMRQRVNPREPETP